MNSKQWMKYLLLPILAMAGAVGCGGGTGSDVTATSRRVTGTFQTLSARAFMRAQAVNPNTENCDLVCADSDGTLNTCDIEATGGFACDEPVGQQVCGIFCDGAYQGTLENSDGSHETDLADNSNENVDLGNVTCDGVDCTAENPADTQNDQDGDGLNDNEDGDDNNNGIPDLEDNNCEGEGTLCDGNWGDCDNDGDGIPCPLDPDE